MKRMVMTIRTAVSLAGTKVEVDCNLLRKHRLRNERAVLLLNELAQHYDTEKRPPALCQMHSAGGVPVSSDFIFS